MPLVEDLLLKEVVDKLGYMGWQVDQGPDPVKVSSCPKVEGCVVVRWMGTRIWYQQSNFVSLKGRVCGYSVHQAIILRFNLLCFNFLFPYL